MPLLQGDKGLDHLHGDRIRLSDHNGGGVYLYAYSYPNFANCVFTGNTAGLGFERDGRGGGIYGMLEGNTDAPTFVHCTVVDNEAETKGGGIYFLSLMPVPITNSIVWNNTAPNDPQIYEHEPGDLVVTYTDVEGGWPGEGNINEPPQLGGGGGYHLLPGSLCIDAGTNAGVNDDVDGEARPCGEGFDMGADEYILCWDMDGDWHYDEACGGDDCDDGNDDVHPGAIEICNDGVDNDCDGEADFDYDTDCDDVVGWLDVDGALIVDGSSEARSFPDALPIATTVSEIQLGLMIPGHMDWALDVVDLIRTGMIVTSLHLHIDGDFEVVAASFPIWIYSVQDNIWYSYDGPPKGGRAETATFRRYAASDQRSVFHSDSDGVMLGEQPLDAGDWVVLQEGGIVDSGNVSESYPPVPDGCADEDEDGFAVDGGECGLMDCDDRDPFVSPAAIEGPSGDPTCSDGVDNDCDGLADGADEGCGGCFLRVLR